MTVPGWGPEPTISRVAVLAALEPADYGAKLSVPSGLVVLEAPGFARQRGDAARQPRPALCDEDAPGEDAVAALEGRTPAVCVEKVLERRV